MDDELNCKSVRRALWDYMAGSRGATGPAGNQPAELGGGPGPREIALHLEDCRDCQLHGADIRSLRSGLKHLPLMHVPPILTTRLQILASRERARALARRDLDTILREIG